MTIADADEDAVGPVLQPGEVARAIIDAMRVSNPSLTVVDRGGYLRVLARGRATLMRAEVERRVRAPFRLPADLEQVMPSFRGRLTIDEESATWERKGGGRR